jgi:hypothetical protein
MHAPLAASPQAVAAAMAPEFDDMDFGLADPGTPTAGDWAVMDALPSWFASGTGQRPPSPATQAPVAPADVHLPGFADWFAGLSPAPDSPEPHEPPP